VKLLLECGANPNEQDVGGNTSLHLLARALIPRTKLAASRMRMKVKTHDEDIKKCAMLLLQHGACPDAKNQEGELASEVFTNFLEPNFDAFQYVTLQCLAARSLKSSGYPVDLIPKHLRAIVKLH